MSNPTRANAINVVAGLHAPAPEAAAPANINYYAEDVFNTDAMREYLPKATAEKLLSTINNGAPLDADIAADVAHAMKHGQVLLLSLHDTLIFNRLLIHNLLVWR